MPSLVQWLYAHVDLDDINNIRRTSHERIGHVRKILTLLRDAGETPKQTNCNVLTKIIDCLCHENCSRHLEISSNTTDDICIMKASIASRKSKTSWDLASSSDNSLQTFSAPRRQSIGGRRRTKRLPSGRSGRTNWILWTRLRMC